MFCQWLLLTNANTERKQQILPTDILHFEILMLSKSAHSFSDFFSDLSAIWVVEFEIKFEKDKLEIYKKFSFIVFNGLTK